MAEKHPQGDTQLVLEIRS